MTAIERTTSYELAIPFEAIGLEAAGDVTGFTFVVNDRDAAERRGWLALTRGLADEKEPYWFAELELLEADAPRDAGAREDAGVADVDAGEVPPEDGGGGCGCSTSGPTSSIPWVVVALALFRRLRRQRP